MGIHAAGSRACPASSRLAVPNRRPVSMRSAAPTSVQHTTSAVSSARSARKPSRRSFLPQSRPRRSAGGALVRPEGPELLFGFASGLLRLFAEGLDLFVVGVGRDEAVQRTVNDGRIDPHRMADADHIEPHGPEPLDEEVRRRIGRRRTQHLFPSTDKGLDELPAWSSCRPGGPWSVVTSGAVSAWATARFWESFRSGCAKRSGSTGSGRA